MEKLNGSLAVLSHSQLLHRFCELVCRDRHCTARMLAVIAEVDHRKLWATKACPSMFAFCVERFHMSEAVTAKRIWAARTARRFPVIFAMVARGELHLSAIHQLAKHLTDDNHRALLERAKHKSSREIERLIAEIAPKPDVPSRVQPLPRRREVTIANALGLVVERESEVAGETGVAAPATNAPDAGAADGQAAGCAPPFITPSGTATNTTSPPEDRTRRRNNNAVTPLSPRRYKIEITVDQDTHDKLRMLQDLLSHQPANTDPAAIVSQALDLLLSETLKKKAALTDQPRRKRDDKQSQHETTHTQTRAIPAATRREVWIRDGGRCAFVDDRGNRCSGTRGLEYHHIRPYGKGGGHETDNIALRCRAHNQHQADLDFGREFMDRKRQGEPTHESEHAVRHVDKSGPVGGDGLTLKFRPADGAITRKSFGR
ncbi:MAG: 5-methylcytosine-specific restriction endonuclease McrA [Hyphomicrobiaceae bacterium]|jgi:5-methylcytosine-specific restriction endonuclease McrA